MVQDKKRILIVDDSSDTRDVYADVLRENGFDISMSMDGKDALDAVKGNAFDLVLLDIMMPVFNGLAFLKQLKTLNLAKPPVVVLLTNLAHEEVIHEAILLGAHSYLIKSDITPAILVSHLLKALGLK